MRCPVCSAELQAAFPGASIACVCGHRVEVLGAAVAARMAARSSSMPSAHGGGPYRSPSTSQEPELSAACPFCGNECPPMVRICPHCDVRLENVRCQRCFSLQPPGAFACARCGHALQLEPLLDATDAPCPRCNHPLEVAPGDDKRTHECPRCGGMFVPRDVFAEIMTAAEIGGALRDVAAVALDTRLRTGGPRGLLADVRYLPCPLCHASMNRVNFGKVSGVIVDICQAHGSWFDAGELTRVVAFVAAGGFAKTRAREREEERTTQSRTRADQVQAQLGASLEVRASGQPDERLEAWRDLLRHIFSW